MYHEEGTSVLGGDFAIFADNKEVKKAESNVNGFVGLVVTTRGLYK